MPRTGYVYITGVPVSAKELGYSPMAPLASPGNQPGGCTTPGAAGHGWRGGAPGMTAIGSLVSASQPA